MAINPTVTRLDDGSWYYSWTAGTGPYEIWVNGKLLSTTTDTNYTYTVGDAPTTPPDLEVFDSGLGGKAQQEQNPPTWIIQWRGLASAAAYLVEKYQSGAWVVRERFVEDGRGYFKYETQAENDDSTAQYRVTALTAAGSAGTPLSFTQTMVRNPETPSVTIALDSAGDVEVS